VRRNKESYVRRLSLSFNYLNYQRHIGHYRMSLVPGTVVHLTLSQKLHKHQPNTVRHTMVAKVLQ
jgi:hypothetical protein